MPIPSYSVLKGKPVSGKVVRGRGTHYQVDVDAPGGPFTVAVNIQSFDGSEVLYRIDTAFTPPDPAGLLALAPGLVRLPSQPGGLALDFVREKIHGAPMVTQQSLSPLPIASGSITFHRVSAKGEAHASVSATPAAALGNAVTTLIENAIAAGNTTLYAFGSAFADKGRVDGIHNIHMNQGNPTKGGHAGDNGTWQDGALFLQTTGQDGSGEVWTAVFISFATESWNTDGHGNAA